MTWPYFPDLQFIWVTLKHPVPSAQKKTTLQLHHEHQLLICLFREIRITHTARNTHSDFTHKRLVYTAYSAQVLFRDFASPYLFMYLFIYSFILTLHNVACNASEYKASKGMFITPRRGNCLQPNLRHYVHIWREGSVKPHEYPQTRCPFSELRFWSGP
jgi:hypothetical protein